MNALRDQLQQAVSACWDSVAVQLPEVQRQFSQLRHSIMDSLGGGGGTSLGAAEIGREYELGRRRFRLLRLLGEGGYSFVYLAREVTPPDSAGLLAGGGSGAGGSGEQRLFALKRVLCGAPDQLAEARHEVEVMRRLGRRPCLLPLLDSAVSEQRLEGGEARQVVVMLFPVYDGGNLFDFVQQQRQQAQQQQQRPAAAAAAAAGGAQQRRQAQLAELRTLLQVFLQVCAALHELHSRGLAHRDVKPQNVLLRPRHAAAGAADGGASASASGAAALAAYDPAPPIEPLGGSREEPGWEPDWAAAPSDAAGAAAAGDDDDATPAVIAVEQEGSSHSSQQPPQQQQRRQQQQEHQHPAWGGAGGQPPEQWWAGRLPAWQERFEAVLMDFGSTRTALVEVASRSQAMAVQEDAERQCTAPYRAPELWDVPSSCTIDDRVDVWSLGCLLYFLVCGQSPFERAAGEAGGSLMLAVVNGRLAWPDDAAGRCPDALRQLVGRCLDTDPATRPRVGEVAAAADRILGQLWL